MSPFMPLWKTSRKVKTRKLAEGQGFAVERSETFEPA